MLKDIDLFSLSASSVNIWLSGKKITKKRTKSSLKVTQRAEE